MADGLIQEYIPETPENKGLSEVSAANATLCDAELFPLEITAQAVSMVQAALTETGGEEGDVLRVGVKGGGCSGFQPGCYR